LDEIKPDKTSLGTGYHKPPSAGYVISKSSFSHAACSQKLLFHFIPNLLVHLLKVIIDKLLLVKPAGQALLCSVNMWLYALHLKGLN